MVWVSGKHNDALHERKTCSANVHQLLRITIEILGGELPDHRIATMPRIAAAAIPTSPSSAIPIVLAPLILTRMLTGNCCFRGSDFDFRCRASACGMKHPILGQGKYVVIVVKHALEVVW